MVEQISLGQSEIVAETSSPGGRWLVARPPGVGASCSLEFSVADCKCAQSGNFAGESFEKAKQDATWRPKKDVKRTANMTQPPSRWRRK